MNLFLESKNCIHVCHVCTCTVVKRIQYVAFSEQIMYIFDNLPCERFDITYMYVFIYSGKQIPLMKMNRCITMFSVVK